VAVSARFADFELDPARFELRRGGRALKLERRPMDLLILLVENNGEVVSREEIVGQLWGKDVFLDTEHGINTAVRKIRQVLRDNPEQPRFVLTVTGRGYRFIADVTRVEARRNGNRNDTLKVANLTESVELATPAVTTIAAGMRQSSARTGIPLSIFTSFIGVAVLSVAWLLRPPLPVPKILGTAQLTNDGLEKGRIATDGLRIYFSERVGNHWRFATVPVSGGEVTPIHTPFPDGEILSISPDKSELLIAEGEPFAEKPLWITSLLGGSPRRLGNVWARGASWSPDGNELAYVHGNDVYLAKADGTDAHKLALVNSDPAVWPWLPTWSPDGKRLRFDLYSMNQHSCALWEFTEKTGNLQKVFSAPGVTRQRCMGVWTPDQKYYLFESWEALVTVPGGAPVPDIWAIREHRPWLHKASLEPVQLTAGPVHFDSLTPSSDGKAIFATGNGQPRGELSRYDGNAHGFSPYLSGISADGVTFSRDGAWVAYVKYPQGELWRSRADGSDPLQLTSPPLMAYVPSWSPDSKRIAFCGQTAGTPWQPYIVSADGSTPRLKPEAEVGTYPTWSPDGNSLILGPKFFSGTPNIKILDLKTHRLSVVPGSEGFWHPQSSPDGQHISAMSTTEDKLMRFDLKTQQWFLQAKTDADEQRWSRDGKYIYFARLGPDPGIFRVEVADNKPHKIVDLKQFHSAGFGWFTLNSEDEPVLLRDITPGSEIYSLQWEAP
jgi:DNA-binding winged helix-turn-helix (wHTH) protein/Tol biopolymer transport system component